MQVSDSTNTALKMLKKKYKVKKMDDVVALLLAKCEPDAYEKAGKIASIQREIREIDKE
jgi:hypothetical protein